MNRGTNTLLALGAITLAGLSLSAAPVRAQDVAPNDSAKPISLNLINVPIQTALRTLFSSAGIRNYTIDPGVQGNANINVSDVPFPVALRNLLNSGNPPLDFTVADGIYKITLKTAAAAPTVSVVPPSGTGQEANAPDANQPKRFYVIPVDSYDAFYIANLVGATGVIEVFPNYPAGGGGGQGGQGGAQGGNRGGIGGGGIGGGTSGVTTIGGGIGGGGYNGGSGLGGGGGFGGGGGNFGGGFGGGGFGR